MKLRSTAHRAVSRGLRSAQHSPTAASYVHRHLGGPFEDRFETPRSPRASRASKRQPSRRKSAGQSRPSHPRRNSGQGHGTRGQGARGFSGSGPTSRPPDAGRSGFTPNPGQPSVGPGSPGTPGGAGLPQGESFRTKATSYFPHNSKMEGGKFDRRDHPLHTLQDYLAGRAPYVSVAMDRKLRIPYGTKLRIKEMEQAYGRPIEFRVVDTGGAFTNRGTSRIDICTANKTESLKDLVNGHLTAFWG